MRAVASTLVAPIGPGEGLHGRVRVPGDKSISHRVLMLAALADGESRLFNLAPGEDCRATRECLAALGVPVRPAGEDVSGGTAWIVEGRGVGALRPAPAALEARNSGTTVRLLCGILAGHRFDTTFTGDASLSRRPMRRVIEPLERMGARITSNDGRLPLTVSGGALSAIAFDPAVPSAQVKSAVLLAGLHARGITSVHELVPTRNHTELALRIFGAEVDIDAQARVRVAGGQRLRPATVRVPGDASSAAFWAVAAAAVPGSEVEIHDVGLNPTRIAFLDVLTRMGAQVDVAILNPGEPEPAGTMRVRYGTLRPATIDPTDVPALIDEIPALAALATFGGALTVTGAGELRVKESDRIAALVAGLRALGATAEEYDDGFTVQSGEPLAGGTADAAGDHRLAMAFSIAALGARASSTILGADAVSVSYPGFFDTLGILRS